LIYIPASNILYGNEITLTKDLIGRNLALEFVGEPFVIDPVRGTQATIQLEVVPEGSLTETSPIFIYPEESEETAEEPTERPSFTEEPPQLKNQRSALNTVKPQLLQIFYSAPYASAVPSRSIVNRQSAADGIAGLRKRASPAPVISSYR
jgi:hypothetical protein